MKKNSIARKTTLAGCIKNQTTSFTHTTSTMADITLTQDTWHSRYIDQIAVPTALQHLPNISGMGRLRDLQIGKVFLLDTMRGKELLMGKMEELRIDNKATNDSLFKMRRLAK